jgi:hypothetical protein
MTLDQAYSLLAVAVLLGLAVSIPSKARAAEDCAIAMLPLAAAWLALSWEPFPALSQIARWAAELVTLVLLSRTGLRHNRRLPLILAAFALIATVSGFVTLSGLGLDPWQHRTITLTVWIAATFALLGSIGRQAFDWRRSVFRKRLS